MDQHRGVVIRYNVTTFLGFARAPSTPPRGVVGSNLRDFWSGCLAPVLAPLLSMSQDLSNRFLIFVSQTR